MAAPVRELSRASRNLSAFISYALAELICAASHLVKLRLRAATTAPRDRATRSPPSRRRSSRELAASRRSSDRRLQDRCAPGPNARANPSAGLCAALRSLGHTFSDRGRFVRCLRRVVRCWRVAPAERDPSRRPGSWQSLLVRTRAFVESGARARPQGRPGASQFPAREPHLLVIRDRLLPV